VTALAHAGVAGGGVVVTAKVAGFMSTAKIMTGVAALVAMAATALVVRQQQATADLRAEVTALRGQGDAATALRAENQRLITEKRAVEDAARVDHEELVKLQAARDAFRKQLAARRGDPAPVSTAGAIDGNTAGGSTPPGMISVDMMKNVGNQTANAAAETLVWAMQNGDVKRAAAMLTMAPGERDKLTAFIQTLPANLREQYGTPEEVMAFLLAGSPKPMGAVQLLGMDQINADEAVHHVQVQFQNGDFRRDDITFRRDTDGGWKQVVSPTTVDRLITYFQGKK
jgi:hypothetical protein